MICFFIFVGFIASTGKPVSASCRIELSPPAVVVKYEDSLSVNCSTSSKQVEGMGWESPEGGIPLTPRVSSLTLKIDSVKDWNLKPVCYVNLLDGTQCSSFPRIIVYQTPDNVSVSQTSQMGPMVEGTNYTMRCDINNVAPGKISVDWYKGNKIFTSKEFQENMASPVNKSHEINLTAHRDDNGIQIWCQANQSSLSTKLNLNAMQSNSVEVTVLYPPTFIKPGNETLEVPADNKIVLNCNATGNPMPKYSWHLPESIKQRYKNHDKNQLILSKFTLFPDIYICIASSTQGTMTKYFTVIEPERNRTTFAAIVGVFICLGVLLVIAAVFFVTPEGTFSLNKGSNQRGQPTSDGPL